MKVKIRKLTNGFCVILPVKFSPNLAGIVSARKADIFEGELWHEIYVKSRAKATRVIKESGVKFPRNSGNYQVFL